MSGYYQIFHGHFVSETGEASILLFRVSGKVVEVKL